jgi:peptide/nickel transport system permease protein
MAAYAVRRLLLAIMVILVITMIGFVALSAAPGDPLAARMEREAILAMSPEQLEAARERLGLNGPLWERYVTWLTDALQGDLGYSIVSGRPVVTEIAARVGPTLLLMTTAIAIGILVGIPFGVVAAVKSGGRLDTLLTGFSLFVISTPTFIIGLVLIYVFGVLLRLLPVGGMQTLGVEPSLVDSARHLLMPATVLGLASAAPIARFGRTAVVEALAADHVTVARSKGLPEHVIVLRHGLRNALMPLITVIALLLPELIGGAIITEQVFGWPGMGRLSVSAAQDRDIGLMVAIMLLVAIAVALANILADLLYAAVDPRVTLE